MPDITLQSDATAFGHHRKRKHEFCPSSVTLKSEPWDKQEHLYLSARTLSLLSDDDDSSMTDVLSSSCRSTTVYTTKHIQMTSVQQAQSYWYCCCFNYNTKISHIIQSGLIRVQHAVQVWVLLLEHTGWCLSEREFSFPSYTFWLSISQ